MRSPGYTDGVGALNNTAEVDLEDDSDETMELELEDMDPSEREEEDETSRSELVEEHYANLTRYFTEEELARIGNTVLSRVEVDKTSRTQWLMNLTKGLKILGINLDNTEAQLWDGSCTASHPLVLETGVKLQQKLSVELFPSFGPVKTVVLGKKTEEKLDSANRVKMFMDYQVTDQMTEFEDVNDKTILFMSLFGTSFEKVYFDDEKQRPFAETVRSDLLVVNKRAPTIDDAERLTHLCPISMRTMENRMIEGFYRKIPINQTSEDIINDGYASPGVSEAGALTPGQIDLGEFDNELERIMGLGENISDEGFLVYDHYCYWNFKDKEELRDPADRKLPYIISVDSSGAVLSIRRDWTQGDITAKRKKTFTAFNFIPFSGFYALGLIHLLGNFNIVLTAIMRSLTDAGQLYNLQGGYKLKGARIVDNSNGYAMGEYKDVEGITGMKLGDAFQPHQFKEPSQVLFAMMQFLNERGGQFANATDQVVADNPGYGNVGTTALMMDVAEKLYTGIYKRNRKAVSRIFSIISELNFEFLGEDPYPFTLPTGEESTVIGTDFDPNIVAVRPSADPDVPSQGKRAQLDQLTITAMTAAKNTDPQLNINFKPVIRSLLSNVNPQLDLKEIFPDEVQAKPMSPLEDIMAVLSGTPIKAFPGQAHQAHIMTKNAWLEDPNQGGSKINAPFVPLIQANIREHMLMGWQESIGAMATGVASDPKTAEMVQAQAAQEIARLSKITAKMDTPEAMVAMAVKTEAEAKMIDAQTKQKGMALDFMKDMNKIAVQAEAEVNRAAATESKANVDLLNNIADNATKIAVEKQKAKNVKRETKK